MKRLLAISAVLVGLAFVPPTGPLEAGYATEVVAVVTGVGSTGDSDLALGPPVGAGLNQGSFDTYTLGSGGSLTLRMEPAVVDGGGADLLVCENAFYVTGTLQSFVEAAFVEVSSDGAHFARFPTSYVGPNTELPPFSGISPARYRGFAGVMPVSAHPPAVDPLNVTAAGGDTFDLHELINDPLVLADQLDLGNVRFVRLVDAVAGTAVDSAGHTVYDCGIGGLAASDIDAVVGLNTLANQSGSRPRIECDQVNGFLVIVLEDLNGLGDIKAGLTVAVNGFPLSFGALLPYFQFTSITPTRAELRSLGVIPPGLFPLVMRVGARDWAGMYGGDGVTLQ